MNALPVQPAPECTLCGRGEPGFLVHSKQPSTCHVIGRQGKSLCLLKVMGRKEDWAWLPDLITSLRQAGQMSFVLAELWTVL